MHPLAQRLIDEEARTGAAGESAGRTAFRVCERLRSALSVLMGAAGFRSLVARALNLSRADAAWLAGVQIKADGSFQFSDAAAAELDTPAGAWGGLALVSQLTGLLIIFIGEALTLRLLHDIWPGAALGGPNAKGSQQ
jgi:hypothetical protein